MMRFVHGITYLAYIGWAIVTGSATIVTRLFRPGQYAQPMIVEVPLRCVTDLEVTMFASSITITPEPWSRPLPQVPPHSRRCSSSMPCSKIPRNPHWRACTTWSRVCSR